MDIKATNCKWLNHRKKQKVDIKATSTNFRLQNHLNWLMFWKWWKKNKNGKSCFP